MVENAIRHALSVRWSLRPPTELKMLDSLYALAAAAPNGLIKRSITELAKVTGLDKETAKLTLFSLVKAQIVEIFDATKHRLHLRIAPMYLRPPTDPACVLDDLSISEMFFRLLGFTVPYETLICFKADLGLDEEDDDRLQACLASLLRKHTLDGVKEAIESRASGWEATRQKLNAVTSALRQELNASS
jgi:hypothetical protein